MARYVAQRFRLLFALLMLSGIATCGLHSTDVASRSGDYVISDDSSQPDVPHRRDRDEVRAAFRNLEELAECDKASADVALASSSGLVILNLIRGGDSSICVAVSSPTLQACHTRLQV
ncbi:MAG: hypothetical protein QM775_16000 [Pirellulales bacterium]